MKKIITAAALSLAIAAPAFAQEAKPGAIVAPTVTTKPADAAKVPAAPTAKVEEKKAPELKSNLGAPKTTVVAPAPAVVAPKVEAGKPAVVAPVTAPKVEVTKPAVVTTPAPAAAKVEAPKVETQVAPVAPVAKPTTEAPKAVAPVGEIKKP